MVCRDGIISLYSFCIPTAIYISLFLLSYTFNLLSVINNSIYWIFLVYLVVVNVLVRAFYKGNDYQVRTPKKTFIK